MSRPFAAALLAVLAASAAFASLEGGALGVGLATGAAFVSGCGASADTTDAGPRTCLHDLDCGDHHYCSEGSVCRTDCFVDLDCLGPTKTAQCNAQGRCIETDLDAIAPDTAAAPIDAVGE